MKQLLTRSVATLCFVTMLISAFAMTVFADVPYDKDAIEDDYYRVISKRDWNLAPGIDETEIILNNENGSKRQVVHSVKVDLNNPYTKVIPGYKGMIPTPGSYGTEITSAQAKNAEALGYGNVVAATNAMLSWYDDDYYKANPHLVGEPLYYGILEGQYYESSLGKAGLNSGYATVVINYDNHPLTGEPRPADMPKVLMRSQTSAITGWEQTAVSVWQWVVIPDKNGDPLLTADKNHTINQVPRTFIGITADGELIISVADGRMEPNAVGLSEYEMGEYMVRLGCIYVANCDGGGSSTFVSQRPGEELKVQNTPSDGSERPVTTTFLVISTAPSDGAFARATIEAPYNYYTPGSQVTFSALGTDAVGTAVDIPADVVWNIKEEGMGSIAGGVFTSNGTSGTVTVQMEYNGQVVGEKSITITEPLEIVGRQLVCTDGRATDITGMIIVDGQSYYAVNGTLQSGWIGLGEDWYFFDKTTYAGWDGERYTDDAIIFNFDHGRVTEGTWAKTRSGIRYWYGPGYYKDTSTATNSSKPVVIDGKTYLFNRQGYMQTGVAHHYTGLTENGKVVVMYYDCGTDGVATLYTGPHEDYFYVEGRRVTTTQIIEHKGDFYYVGSGHKLAKDKRLNFTKNYVDGHFFADGARMHTGYYDIGADGKFIIKNGPVGDYFYKNDVVVKGNRIVEFEGDFYYVGSGNKLAKSKRLNFTAKFVEGLTFADGTPMHTGYYDIDAEGRFIIKNGPVGDYFYLNDVQVKGNRIVEFESHFYYVGSGNKLVKSKRLNFTAKFVEGKFFADGAPMHTGYYDIDAEGRFIIRNGPVGDYFYHNDIMVKGNRVVEFEGHVYYVGSGNKLAKSKRLNFPQKYLDGHFFADGTPMHAGYYDIDAEGRFIIKNGPVGDYFYKNDILVKGNKMVKFEGDIYYIGSGNKLAKSKRLYFTANYLEGMTFADGTSLRVGYYEFDADGKLIPESGPVVKNGPVGDYFYRNGKLVTGNQLIEFEGNWYYIGSGNKLAKNKRLYFEARFVAGKTYSDGCLIEIGYHTFDEDGKMIS